MKKQDYILWIWVVSMKFASNVMNLVSHFQTHEFYSTLQVASQLSSLVMSFRNEPQRNLITSSSNVQQGHTVSNKVLHKILRENKGWAVQTFIYIVSMRALFYVALQVMSLTIYLKQQQQQQQQHQQQNKQLLVIVLQVPFSLLQNLLAMNFSMAMAHLRLL